MTGEKLPSALSIPQVHNTSNTSSPRALSTSLLNSDSSRIKSPPGSSTPTSVPQVLPNPTSYATASNGSYSYDNPSYMNPQTSSSFSPLDYGHHMSQGQPPNPQTATSGYQQPPLLQPSYSSPHQPQFPQFSFPSPNGVGSPAGHPSVSGPMGGHPTQQLLPLPNSGMGASQTSMTSGGPQTPASSFGNHSFDTTGQVAPPGMKPRVAATLWEDEGSLCFQVEARGVCVARREDNHMINGTKLLNVAGMTRGRRDGILKSEKVRHVVKIGPMHLKGVWIPFERALDFANKEKITELLYPLFVHNIGAFLYHPTNTQRTNAVVQAAERRRADHQVLGQSQALQQQQQQRRDNTMIPSSQPPPLHGMHNALPPSLPGPHPTLGAPRPPMDRSLSFPTPPSSASSVMGVGNQDGSFGWNSGMVPGNGNQALAIDTMMNSRSMPNTPATTPPGGPVQQLQGQYQPSTSLYSSNNSNLNQQSITQQNMQRFNQPGQYAEGSNMGPPPTSRGPAATLSRPASRQQDAKDDEPNGIENGEHGSQTGPAEDGEPEAGSQHEEEYTTQDNGYTNGHRSNGYYQPMTSEHTPHLSPELNSHGPQGPSTPARSTYGSPNLNAPRTSDGGASSTPRTTATPQQWMHGSSGYSTPPRTVSANGTATRQPPQKNLYEIVSGEAPDQSSEPNGSTSASAYSAHTGLGVTLPSQTNAQAYSALNGSSTPPSNKRVRGLDDDEEQASRPSSRGHDEGTGGGLKRRKTIQSRETASGPIDVGSTFDRSSDGRLNRTRSAIAPRTRAR